MRKISGQLLTTKSVSLSRAAKLISRFAAVDNGSSPAVSLYLERTAEAFNNLVQFHSKRLQTSDAGDNPDRKREKAKGSGSIGKKDRKAVNDVAETNLSVDDAKALIDGERKKENKENKKKKKKRKIESVDAEEKSSGKKRRAEDLDS